MANRMPDLTIEELAERGGVSVRTIRFYISEGLLPSSGGRGKAAAYGEEHLLRLRLIRRLGEQRVPLAEQRERLSRLSLEDVRALLAEEDQRSAELERARTTPSPREYVAGLLERARAARQAAPSNVQASGRVRGDQAPAWSAGETPASEGGGEADLSALGETGAPAAAPAASAPAIDAAEPPVPETGESPRRQEASLPYSSEGRREWGPSSQVWQRWEIAPGVELHVRSDAARRHATLIARLLQVAGALTRRSERRGASD